MVRCEFRLGPCIAFGKFTECMADGLFAAVSGGETVGLGEEKGRRVRHVIPHESGELAGYVTWLAGDDVEALGPGVGAGVGVVRSEFLGQTLWREHVRSFAEVSEAA